MRYLSVCSGIEAASVAWEPLGFVPAAFSEIEPFPCSVLRHRFPGVPNLGDMTKFREWNIEPGSIGIQVGGTPCQDLSQGGKGGGWEAGRSGLAWSFVEIARTLKPRWIIWENVQGSLRGKHRAGFIAFARKFDELGYCFSWRVFNARYFGLPQRRPRVFAVASLGTDCSRQILLESEGVIGIDTQAVPPTVSVCLTARGYGSLDDRETYVADGRRIRRLTPRELERCMGFPDDWTLVPYRGKPAADGPRSRSLGNSMPVPVMSWIGSRIKALEERNRDA